MEPFSSSPAGGRKIVSESFTLFIFLAALYILLRSHDFLAVDGAIRAVKAFRGDAPTFSGNNHLLYPFWIGLWMRGLSWIGHSPDSPLAFMRLAQTMNGVAAAFCAGALYGLLRSHNVGRRIALAFALTFALSRAVMLHATNSAEPLPGLLWSVLALVVVVISRRRRTPSGLLAAGALLALAMASYQSMVLMALVCGVLAFSWEQGSDQRFPLAGLKRLSLIIIGFLGAAFAIYGASYVALGARSFSDGTAMFFKTEPVRVYGQLSLSRLANFSTGFPGNVMPVLPVDFAGIRSLVLNHLRDAWFAAWVSSLILLATFVVAVLLLAYRDRRRLSSDQRTLVLAGAAGLVPGIALLLFWNPQYDKLWLQPLFLLCLMLACATQAVMQQRHVVLARLALVLFAAIAGANLTAAARSANGTWPHLDSARQVAALVRPEDLVITDWDPVSQLYEGFFAAQYVDFPAAAVLSPDSAVPDLQQRINATQRNGGRIYFLALLDETPESWEAFLGNRCGVPYGSLDHYRQHARIALAVPGNRGVVTLRRFPSDF